MYRREHSSRKTQRKSFAFGKEWWISCTSIRPNDDEWDYWRASQE